jgi:hypothetical protein
VRVISAVVAGEPERIGIDPPVVGIPAIPVPGIAVADADAVRRIVGGIIRVIVEFPPGGFIIAGLCAVGVGLVVGCSLIVRCALRIVSLVHVSSGRTHLCIAAGKEEKRDRSKEAEEKSHFVFHGRRLVMNV